MVGINLLLKAYDNGHKEQALKFTELKETLN